MIGLVNGAEPLETSRAPIRRLMLYYMLALGLLFASVAGSLVLTQIEARQLTIDARDINVSGRQRMLSQRIVYLASEMQRQTGAAANRIRDDLSTAVNEFEAAIEIFERAHADLTQSPDLPREIGALYFSDADGPSLDARTRDFIASARAVLASPADRAALERLKEIERAGLLRDLDTVVTAFERASVARIEGLRHLEALTIALAVLIIVIEIAFVFRPGHRMLRRTFDALTARNDHLTRLQQKLDAALAHSRQQNRALKEACAESEALRREQSEFTYAVSHDMKSPANTIGLLLSELDAAHGPELDEDARSLIAEAQRTVVRMTGLVEDVLEYSRITDSHDDPERVALGEVVEDVMQGLSPTIAQTGAEITVRTLPTVHGYREQLRILVSNLLTNAIKYQPPGGRPVIEISGEPRIDSAASTLRVRDNGIGIASEDRERVFGLFQRLHTRELYAGSGLGLATCQRIAANHKGEIAVFANADRGCTFEVTLAQPSVREKQQPDLKVAA